MRLQKDVGPIVPHTGLLKVFCLTKVDHWTNMCHLIFDRQLSTHHINSHFWHIFSTFFGYLLRIWYDFECLLFTQIQKQDLKLLFLIVMVMACKKCFNKIFPSIFYLYNIWYFSVHTISMIEIEWKVIEKLLKQAGTPTNWHWFMVISKIMYACE